MDTILDRLNGTSIYRHILRDEVVTRFIRLLNANTFSEFMDCYGDFFHVLTELTGDNLLTPYICDLILYDKNIFTQKISCGSAPQSIIAAAQKDIEALLSLASIPCRQVKERAFAFCRAEQREMIYCLPEYVSENTSKIFSKPDFIKPLMEFHRKNGYGKFAKYKAFLWREGLGLFPVENPDTVRFEDLIGYQLQKEAITNNTMQFLEGFSACNMLLYGDRGTGKSSTVKALVNEFGDKGLRLVEVPAYLMGDLHKIIAELSKSHLKFIVFIDDLIFDAASPNYTALKSILEGSVET